MTRSKKRRTKRTPKPAIVTTIGAQVKLAKNKRTRGTIIGWDLRQADVTLWIVAPRRSGKTKATRSVTPAPGDVPTIELNPHQRQLIREALAAAITPTTLR